MVAWKITTAPAAEPLVLADMKNYLKVPASVTADDDLITDYIREAREFVERKTARALITQTVTQYLDKWPDTTDKNPRVICPHIAPVQSVTSIKYVASTDTPATYTLWDNTSNAKYFLDNTSGMTGIGPARIVKNPDVDWPDLADYLNAVELVYVAGYGAAGSSVPGPLLTAMRRLIGAWYYGRKGSFTDDWNMVGDLLDPYKVHK